MLICNFERKKKAAVKESMRVEYSFDYAQAVRGKYRDRVMHAKRLVEIDADVLEAFSTPEELNAALRGLIEASKHVHVVES